MQLLIKTTKCKAATLKVEASETFDLVMAKINEMAHECTFHNSSCLPSILAETLLCIRTTTGKSFTLGVEGSDTFDLVKAKFEDISSLDNLHDIFWELIPKPDGWWPWFVPFPLFVRILNGKTFTMALKQGNTICDIKYYIMDKEQIMPYMHDLFFAGRRLEGELTLFDYNIVGGSTVDLVLEGTGVSGDVEISVETTDGKKFPITINEDIFISDVKMLIKQQNGIPEEQQRLVYAEQELEDDRLLRSYNINEKATFRLVVAADMKIRVLMRLHFQIAATQKTIRLDVGSTDTVHAVKAKIQAQEGIPTGQQVLFLPNKRLQEDAFTLADYLIHNESTLHLAQLLGETLLT